MATLTMKLPPVADRKAHTKTRGFWHRLLDAVLESRRRQAEAEAARHRRILRSAADPDRAYRVSARDLGVLPFVR